MIIGELNPGDWQPDFNIEAVRTNGINFEMILKLFLIKYSSK
jgi:hypothetical protein